MKEIKYKRLWALDVEINNQMIQVYCSKHYFDCSFKSKEYKNYKTKIQQRKVLTDKY